MQEVKMMIVMPWKMVVGVITIDSNNGVYHVKDAIVFENVMTNQGVMIPLPNTMGSADIKALDLDFTIPSVIVEPFKIPEQLLSVYNELTSVLLKPTTQRIIQ